MKSIFLIIIMITIFIGCASTVVPIEQCSVELCTEAVALERNATIDVYDETGLLVFSKVDNNEVFTVQKGSNLFAIFTIVSEFNGKPTIDKIRKDIKIVSDTVWCFW